MRFQKIHILFVALALAAAACAADDNDVDADDVAVEDDAADDVDDDVDDDAADADEGDAEAYGDGDVVRLIVGQDPGGGYDTQARLLQPYFQEALREETGSEVTVIVENRPGGNNVVAAQEVYNAAPDGTTLYIGGTERMVLIDVLEDDVDFAVSELAVIGGLGASNRGIVARTDLDLPEPTFQALTERARSERVRLTTPSVQRLNLLNALLEEEGEPTGFDFVSLGGGTGGAMAAILRGDIEAVWTTAASMAIYVEDNPDEIEYIVSLGCEREDEIPDVPTIEEQGVPNARAICSTIGSFERVIVATPGTSGERYDALVAALESTTEVEEYRERATDAGDPPVHRTPEQIHDVFTEVEGIYSEYEDVLREE